MAYGLRILNDNLELLIDSEYVNPTFVQKLEFNTTPTSTESGIYVDSLNQLHAGYLKNTHTTPVAVLNSGNYIVLWGIPDTGYIDVYYNFPTSVMDVNRTLTCEVYSGGSFIYTLPTAYIFAVDPGGLSTLSSSAPALRMYNSSQQLTFNSNYTQLVPYSFSSGFFPPSIGYFQNVPLTSPTNGIYLLPKAYYLYGIEDSANPGTSRQILYDLMYKRFGSTMYMKSISSYWTSVNGNIGLVNDSFGVSRQVSIMVADGDLYQGANGGTVSTTAPTYTLGANYATVNETNNTTITVTLTTANVTNGTLVYYNVTGINAADLISGSLNGSFTVQNNTATKSFVVAADTVTEGTETFLLTLVGISQSTSISILDTSRTPYSWSAPSATSVNEGSSIYIDFNALYNDPIYPVTFGFDYPATPIPGQSGETIYAYPDINFTYAIPSGADYTRVTVSPRADLQVEGLEKWRMFAEVGGTRYYSADITINDTTTSSITAANNWLVGTDNTVTINVIGGLGKTVNLYSIDSSVIDVKAGSPSSWAVNSSNFTATTTYQAKTLNPGTFADVGLWLKNGEEFLTPKYITISSPNPVYSWATSPLTVNEGETQSLQFNYTNAPANTVINFSLQPPSTGTSASAPADGSLNTTSFTTPATVSSGSVSVSYSIVADSTTEVVEKFLIQAQIGSSTYPSQDITVNDTSLTPSYGINAVNPPWDENTTEATTITLSNVNGYTYFPVSNNAAVTCQTTSFTVTSNSFTTTLYWNVGAVTADTTVTLELRRSRSNGVVDASTSVVVTNYVAPTYVLSANPTSSSEGNNFTITLTTNQSGSFPYTVTGIQSADLEGADTTLTGSLANNGTRTFNVKSDAVTENTEVFSVKLNNNLSNTLTVSISDTSKSPTSISRTGSTSGTSGTAFSSSFTVAVNGSASTATWSQTGTIPTGLSLTQSGLSNGYYSTYTLSGTPTASGTFNFTINATTATGETATANYSVVIGVPAATYSWGGVDNVDENSVTNTMSFNFTNAVNAAVTFALLAPTGTYRSGVSDITLSTTSGTANGTSSISVNYSAAADQATEGYEYFRIRATVGGVNYDTTDIVISDTSLWLANGTLISASCLNYGVSPYTLRQVYANGSGGTYQEDTTNSPTCGYTAPVAPQWRFHRTVGSITWTVPTGTTSIAVIVIGGGAGGRSQTGGGGGGGAGGVNYIDPVAVTPGQVLTMTVGAGGGSNTNGSSSSVTGTGINIVAGGGITGVNSTSSNGGNQGSGNFGNGLGGSGALNAGGGGGGVGGLAGEPANGYSATAGVGGDGGASYPLFENFPPGTFNVCGGGGGAALNEAGQGGFASGGQGAGPTGTGTNNGGAAVDHGGGGGGAKSGGTGGSGFRGMIAWYG